MLTGIPVILTFAAHPYWIFTIPIGFAISVILVTHSMTVRLYREHRWATRDHILEEGQEEPWEK